MSVPDVIGLDLSITATGLCDVTGYCSTVGGPAKLGDRRLSIICEAMDLRLAGMVDGGLTRIDPVDLVVIEDIPTHAHGAGVTAMVHGAIRLRLLEWLVPYALVPPATLKKFATGRGNATKADMAVALYKRAGIELADDNQVDAWWLRAAGMQHLGQPVADLPETQVRALDKVAWPTREETHAD